MDEALLFLGGLLIGQLTWLSVAIYERAKSGRLRLPGADLNLPPPAPATVREDGSEIGQAGTEYSASGSAGEDTTDEGDGDTEDLQRPELYRLAEKIARIYHDTAHPRDLAELEDFQAAAHLLESDSYSNADVVTYGGGDNLSVACVAFDALCRRSRDPSILRSIVETLDESSNYARYFALKALEHHADGPIVSLLLSGVDTSWSTNLATQTLRDFLERRFEIEGEGAFDHSAFEQPATALEDDDLDFIEKQLRGLSDERGSAFVEALASWRSGNSAEVDLPFLRSFARLYEESEITAQPVLEHDALADQIATVLSSIKGSRTRSVLLVGEPGAGKTTLCRALATQLLEDRWTIFEAGGTDLVAGQSYFGQLEERVKALLRNIRGQERLLWVIPEFQTLSTAGKHRDSTTSVLDMILPAIRSGSVRVVGRITPTGLERLLATHPSVRAAMELVPVRPISDEATMRLALDWTLTRSKDRSSPFFDEDTLREAQSLSGQFLSDKANPGRLLEFLDATLQLSGDPKDGKISSGAESKPATIDDLLSSLARMTGLPASILDDRRELNVDGLRSLFHRRVLGQPEAVDCLVERVSMIKAGLTDPTRPQGVFLFTGPTGTGKTEIAKTLAEFLFGSSSRMLRIDMSELQDPSSLDRLIGSSDSMSDGKSLARQIREQPFSVVLCDEFEKAHSRVWDVFLQLFDDGRLTDRQGNTADFRHAIVILTSNVGGDMAQRTSVGFGGGGGFRDASEEVQASLSKAFRPEFLNRIDRIIAFRPLSRAIMRQILEKDLDDVLERRGLRNRQWAVEWDESALEFLLERGFSPQFGARPLKRAIDRYLLSPLALTIVRRQFPEGDQFLFVRSDGRSIQVTFVDPDAPEGQDGARKLESPEEGRPQTLEGITLDARGTIAEIACLETAYEKLEELVTAEEWRERKQRGIDAMQSNDLWSSDDRFEVLGEAEYVDRIEAGLKTAGSLLRRLVGPDAPQRETFSPDLVGRLAQQLLLLRKACSGLRSGAPQDAFVRVSSVRDSASLGDQSDDFAARIAKMYTEWAKKRRMSFDLLREQHAGSSSNFEIIAAVSGYAAFSFLEGENGLHVLEIQDPERPSAKLRFKVRVEVVPQPTRPPPRRRGAALALARGELDRNSGSDDTVVRRYRERPSPLVRDSVGGWRTGRLERVLGGDFDLFQR